MTAPERTPEELFRDAVAAVNAPGVMLPPWRVELTPGSAESARKNSIGIMGGCCIEHDHGAEDDEAGACVLTEFAVVWNNDARLPAGHPDNARERATAEAIVAAFNALSGARGEYLMLELVQSSKVRADLEPLRRAMVESPYTVEAWGRNICEYAAKELVELRRENRRLKEGGSHA